MSSFDNIGYTRQPSDESRRMAMPYDHTDMSISKDSPTSGAVGTPLFTSPDSAPAWQTDTMVSPTNGRETRTAQNRRPLPWEETPLPSYESTASYATIRESAVETVYEPSQAIEDYVRASGFEHFINETAAEIVFEPAAGVERDYLADPEPKQPRKGRQPNAAYRSYLDKSPAFASEFLPEPQKFREKTLATLTGFCDKVHALVTPSYAVGGCVRDTLLGIPCHDYDFCTPLKPSYVEKHLKSAGMHLRLDGRCFGTIGFKLEGNYVEVTTFRTDHYTSGNRYPEVEFVDRLETDLGRRDFTINAMAFIGGNVIDPFDGYCDLTTRIIRSVGRARHRMEEDPLRILRAARFASQLDFHMDEEIQQATRSCWPLLASVSRERWGTELDRLIAGKNPIASLNILRKSGALSLLLPEISHLNERAWGLACAAIKKTEPVKPEPCEKLVLCEKGPACLKGAADHTTREKYVANKRLAILLVFTSPHVEVVREVARRVGLGLCWTDERTRDLLSLIELLMVREQTKAGSADMLTVLENAC